VNLTSDRFDVSAGERVRGVLLVPSLGALLAVGGVSHVANELEDLGFREISVFDHVPTLWRNGRDVPTPDGLAVLLWWEATAVRDLSYRRELAEDLRLVRAWDPSEDGDGPVIGTITHVYAVDASPPGLVGTRLVVFGQAYPFEGRTT
jgi:hypothetical protein